VSYTPIRDKLVDVLKTVPGIGNVHYRPRSAPFAGWEEFIRRHIKRGRVNTWEVSRPSVRSDLIAVGNAQGNQPFYHYTHTIRIRGGIGVRDAEDTNTDFHDVVDGILDAIRENVQLGGLLVLPMLFEAPVIGHAMFKRVLIHHAEFALTAVERTGGGS